MRVFLNDLRASTAALLVALAACGGGGQPDASSSDGPPTQTTALAYDDGRADEALSVWGNQPGAQVAVRFTPPSYPATLERADFFIMGGFGQPTTAFRVQVYAADGDGGKPRSSLLADGVDAAASAGNSWVVADLSPYAISVVEGDLYVAMRWTTAPGEEGEDAQFIGADLNDADHRSWYSTAESVEWGPISELAGGWDVDIMIRATVSHPATR